MNISSLSTWGVGVINGYNKEKKLPSSITYSLIGVSSVISMISSLDRLKGMKPLNAAKLFIGIPLVVGSVFCVGHHVGKVVRLVQDDTLNNDIKKKEITV